MIFVVYGHRIKFVDKRLSSVSRHFIFYVCNNKNKHVRVFSSSFHFHLYKESVYELHESCVQYAKKHDLRKAVFEGNLNSFLEKYNAERPIVSGLTDNVIPEVVKIIDGLSENFPVRIILIIFDKKKMYMELFYKNVKNKSFDGLAEFYYSFDPLFSGEFKGMQDDLPPDYDSFKWISNAMPDTDRYTRLLLFSVPLKILDPYFERDSYHWSQRFLYYHRPRKTIFTHIFEYVKHLFSRANKK